jgi:hypothetical protein
MKGKFIYLFLALLLPGLVFVFLKLFGRNEFAVAPLYQTTAPASRACGPVTIPYQVPDSVMSQLPLGNDSLVVVVFGEMSVDGEAQFTRVQAESKDDAVQLIAFKLPSPKNVAWKQCSFFLAEPFNTVLVDYTGRIRGEYDMNDRKEVDRLLTEMTIILKKY